MNAKPATKVRKRTFHPAPEPVPIEIPCQNLPEIEDLAALLSEPEDTPPEIISGLLHQGAKMVIGGGSKSYKTWLLSDLALSVATGSDWLGFTTSQGKVLYINLEIQREFFRNRLATIGQAKEITVVADLFHVWNLRGYAADLSSLITEVLERVGQRYALIIVDPIYKALGDRDENAAGDIGTLLNELEKLAVKSGAAVVFGAHFSKGNQSQKEAIDRIGGSGVFARDPDSIFVLTQHEEEGAFTVDATLRNHAPIKPFVVRWNFPLMHRDASLNPSKLKQVGRAKDHTADELLGLIGNGEVSSSDWKAAAKEETGMAERTFYRLLKELKTSKRVRKSPLSKLWIRA